MSEVIPAILVCSRIVILAAAAWAAVVDVRERIVPYTCMILVAVSGALIRVLAAAGPLWPGVAGAAGLFVALSLLAGLGVFGGGDAKLIAAAALGESVGGMLTLLLDIALAGGVLACVYLVGGRIFRGMTRGTAAARDDEVRGRGPLVRLLGVEAARMAAREPMPYAVAILAALLWRITPEVVQCLSGASCSS